MRNTRRAVVAGGLAAGAAVAGGGVAAVTGRDGGVASGGGHGASGSTGPADGAGHGGPAPTVDRARLPRVVRPARQHEWDAYLRRDAAGNRLPPRHQRLLLSALAADPTPELAWRAEAALRRLERAVPLGSRGLLVTVAWGPNWFRRIGVAPPIPAAVLALPATGSAHGGLLLGTAEAGPYRVQLMAGRRSR